MKKIIALIGPTGVGKTRASILLAKALDTEIISSDSMQIYRYMDIGTAKPSFEERKAVKHHMIDIIYPWELYSTGKYIRDVKPIIENLLNRGKIPIIVGGTGLYFKAMTRGIFEGPSADWKLRAQLMEKEAREQGYLYNYLKKIDPQSTSRISSNDYRRIIRAIEVFLKEKKTITELQNNLTKPLPYEFIKIGLTRHRLELYKIIEERVDMMVKKGLLEEVKYIVSLIFEHSSENISHLPALQAIGYKELYLYLRDKITIDEAISLIKKRTRNYAKRQFTWFKKEEDIRWLDISGIHDAEKICELIRKRDICLK